MPRRRDKPRRTRPELTAQACPRVAYADRPRDFDFMGWIKTLDCCALEIIDDAKALKLDGNVITLMVQELGGCEGVTECDHAGTHGLSHKSDDDTGIPLCVKHHRLPGMLHLLAGIAPRGLVRVFKNRMIERYQAMRPAPRVLEVTEVSVD